MYSFSIRDQHSEEPWTQKLWIYDLRTDKRFTLKTNPLRDADLQDFITVYNAKESL